MHIVPTALKHGNRNESGILASFGPNVMFIVGEVRDPLPRLSEYTDA